MAHAGYMNEVGHTQHTGFTKSEMYTQYKGQNERMVHTQNGRNPLHTCRMQDCKLRCCHHPRHAAFGTLGLGGPLPLLAV
jgi:hypothetical protein